MFKYKFKFIPSVFFFFAVLQSLSGSFSPCPGFLNCEYGGILILMRVTIGEKVYFVTSKTFPELEVKFPKHNT
jgi:hypothetical protein